VFFALKQCHCVAWKQQIMSACIYGNNTPSQFVAMETTEHVNLLLWKQQNMSACCHGNNRTFQLVAMETTEHVKSLLWKHIGIQMQWYRFKVTFP